MGVEVSVTGNMIGANGLMTLSSGENILLVPSQFRGQIKYVNIQNTTNNSMKIFGMSDDINSTSPVSEIGARMVLSIKLTQRISEGMKVSFLNDDSSTNGKLKNVDIIWSEFSRNWNHSLAPSYPMPPSSTTNVVVTNTPHSIVDNFPASFGISGTATVAISGTPAVTVSGTPAVTVSGTPSVVLVPPSVVPLRDSKDNAVTTLTANGVASKNNYITYIDVDVIGGVIGATDINVQLKDNGTVVWQRSIPKTSVAGTYISKNFYPALKISTGNPAILSVTASGTAGTLIESNMGYINQ